MNHCWGSLVLAGQGRVLVTNRSPGQGSNRWRTRVEHLIGALWSCEGSGVTKTGGCSNLWILGGAAVNSVPFTGENASLRGTASPIAFREHGGSQQTQAARKGDKSRQTK